MTRLTVGRLQVYLEPRDVWIGVYVAPDAIYVCPLPMLVFRWTRRRRWLLDKASDELIGGIKTEPPPKPVDLSAIPIVASDAVPDGQIYVVNSRLVNEALWRGQPIPPAAAVRLDVDGGAS
ncbi:MAG: hypothetical protein ACM30G_20350 [Micromonosporaceae bacterium]